MDQQTNLPSHFDEHLRYNRGQPTISPKGRDRSPRQQQSVIRHSTCPHPRTRRAATQKARPAARSAIKVRFVHHPRELHARDADASVERKTLCVHEPREGDERDGRGRERGEDGAGVGAEEQRGRADADFDVVGFVLVCVDRVVHDRPAEPAGVQWQRDAPVHRSRDGCPPEECTPVECQACSSVRCIFILELMEARTQDCLGPVSIALHKGI